MKKLCLMSVLALFLTCGLTFADQSFYDDNGNLIKHVFDDGGVMEQEFDANGNRTLYTFYNPNSGQFRREETTYDEQGRYSSFLGYDSQEAYASNKPDNKGTAIYDDETGHFLQYDYNTAESIESDSPDSKYEAFYNVDTHTWVGMYYEGQESVQSNTPVETSAGDDTKTVYYNADGKLIEYGNYGDPNIVDEKFVSYDSSGKISKISGGWCPDAGNGNVIDDGTPR